MNRKKLIKKLAAGAFNNVSFEDAQRLATEYGFELIRVSGSHHIYNHPNIEEQINLQESEGEAKPYQLRQLLRLVERYNLVMEGDDE